MSDRADVSIIIPVFNASQFVGRAIDSCLSQSFKNFELILVNDGSTDDSLYILKDYAARITSIHSNPIIRVLNIPNSGVVKAREIGVKNATGEFFLFLDADDQLAEEALQKLVNAVSEDVDMVIGDILQTEIDGSTSIIRYGNLGSVSGKDHFDWIINHRVGFLWGKLIRKQLFNEIKVMPYGIKFCEDLIQMIQLSYSSRKVSHIGSLTYNYIQHPESACNKAMAKEEYAQRFADLCKKILDFVKLDMYDEQCIVKLKVLFLYYCRLYLCVIGKWGRNYDLRHPFYLFLYDDSVASYYKFIDSRRYKMTWYSSCLYPFIAFFYRRQLKNKGRIR